MRSSTSETPMCRAVQNTVHPPVRYLHALGVVTLMRAVRASSLLGVMLLFGCSGGDIFDVDISNGLITTDVDKFIGGLHQADNRYRGSVWIRSSAEPPIRIEQLRELPEASQSVMLLPPDSDNRNIRRRSFGLGNPSDEEKEAIVELLREHNIRIQLQLRVLPGVLVDFPSDVGELRAVLDALVCHPNLDWIDASQVRVVSPDR